MNQEARDNFAKILYTLGSQASKQGNEQLNVCLSWLAGALVLDKVDVACADAVRHIKENYRALRDKLEEKEHIEGEINDLLK